jgi:hypothetical protein
MFIILLYQHIKIYKRYISILYVRLPIGTTHYLKSDLTRGHPTDICGKKNLKEKGKISLYHNKGLELVCCKEMLFQSRKETIWLWLSPVEQERQEWDLAV